MSRRYSLSVSSALSPGCSRRPSVCAIAGTTSSGSRTGASWTKAAPPGNRSSTLRRELQGEPRLAGAAGADQRQQPHVVAGEQRAGLGELALAADEGVRHRGEVGEPVVERVQRRELGGQAVELELVELLRAGQVLEQVLAEVAELDVLPSSARVACETSTWPP